MAGYDLRCSKLHARLVQMSPRFVEHTALEVKCDSRICRGPAAGVVVLHYFSLNDGRLLETKRYRDPVANGKVEVKQ